MTGNLDLVRTGAHLVLIELDLVETFLRIARTSPNPETRKRNLSYAREAYETARRYLSRTLASPDMLRGFAEQFSGAKEELLLAGETVT